ncbi:hypothetical protein AHF37_11222 [Paragonimus kellicotti]|nr:hypothetical protein AHF37_11222 [Paragonimus kellicotti]
MPHQNHRIAFHVAYLSRRQPANGTSEFRWPDEPADFFNLTWSNGANTGNCIDFAYKTDLVLDSLSWKTNAEIESRDCSLQRSIYCEHKVPECTNAPGGFDPETMNFVPTSPNPRATVKAECKPGTFMKEASSPVFQDGPQVNNTLKQNEYYCTGQRKQTVIEDPMTFETSFQYSGYNVTSCERKSGICLESCLHRRRSRYSFYQLIFRGIILCCAQISTVAT